VETVQFQSYVFLYSVYGGILIGILYDIYRVIKGGKKSEKLIISLWDALFLLSVFSVMIWAIFSSSYGGIRVYVLIGFVVGFYLYEKLLGRTAAGLFHYICKGIGSFLRKISFILVFPVKLLYSSLCRCYYVIAGMVQKGKNRLRKISRLPKQVIESSKKRSKPVIRIKRKKDN